MYKCDIKIMASPRRYAYVLNMCKVLGLDIEKDVFFDDRPNGGDAAYTSRKTWALPAEDGITHRCVLQDDLILCKDFEKTIDRLVEIKPDVMFSLFCSRSSMAQLSQKYGTPQLVLNKKSVIWGQAMLVPLDVSVKVYAWGDFIASQHGCKVFHDDVLFGEYAASHGVESYTPIPNLVQHLCPNRSLLGFNNKNKVSKVFDIDAGALAWESACESSISIPNSMKFYK